MVEKVVIMGIVEGRIDENNVVKFNSQVRTDVPRSVFEGTIGADGALSGKCQIGTSSGTKTGTWQAEHYQPSGAESFFDNTRRASALMLLAAAFFAYFGLVEPIMLAQANQDKIAVNSQFVMFMSICGPMGLAGLILGEKINKFCKEDLVEKRSVKGWILTPVLILLGMGLYQLLVNYLISLGYEWR